jgi:hypothetical protein
LALGSHLTGSIRCGNLNRMAAGLPIHFCKGGIMASIRIIQSSLITGDCASLSPG